MCNLIMLTRIMFICKIKLFYILFVCQTMYVLSDDFDYEDRDTINTLRMELENVLNHNFNKLPQLGEVLVWRTLKDTKKYYIEDYRGGFRAFQSHETYLIFTKIHQFYYVIFYWVGETATLDCKKIVAKYGIMLKFLVHKLLSRGRSSVELSRECEIFQSGLFQQTIKYLRKGLVNQYFPPYLRERFTPNPPNLYILKGSQKTTRVKKVPISLKWVKQDTCFFVVTGPYMKDILYPIIIYCGNKATKITQERVFRLGVEYKVHFYDTYQLEDAVYRIEDVKCRQYKLLIELLEDRNNYTLFDVDISNDDCKDADAFIKDRDNSVIFLKIYCENILEKIMKTEIIVERPIHTNFFHDHNVSYLLDSSSIAGIILMYGKYIDTNAAVWAIEVAEKYLHEAILSLHRPLPEICELN